MKISRKIHLQIRLQNLAFSLLFVAIIGLLAWLSTRYSAQFDWTAGARHTLSEASRKVLDLLEGPVQITAYARDDRKLREQIDDQIGRFTRYKKSLSLNYVNPDTQPDKVRELGITVDGELVVEYQGRSEKIQQAGEAALTNALQRLLVSKNQQIAVLAGHGERSVTGRANHDLSQFADELGRKGVKVSTLNLAVTPTVPDDAAFLVIAGPTSSLLPGELAIIQNYVEQGRNLLWLAEPGNLRGLAPLAEKLGLRFLPGVVVDASTQLFGITDPTFALVAEYPPHPITAQFHTMTIFPAAAALERAKAGEGEYEIEPFLSTLARSWTETGPIEGKIQFDAGKGEREGPLTIGFALSRQIKAAEPPKRKEDASTAGKKDPPDDGKEKSMVQRIVVLGDGDFLSNAYLGEGGNIELGTNIVHWLTRDDDLINIPSRTSPDRALNFSESSIGVIAVGFLFLLPIALFGTGAFVWFQRRRR